MDTLAKYFVIFVVCAGAYKYWNHLGAKAVAKQMQSGKVVAFVLKGDTGSAIEMEYLRLKGVRPEIINVEGVEDIEKLGIKDQLMKEGVMSDTSFTLPFYKVGDRFYTGPSFNDVVSRQPTAITREAPGKYVIIYGPENCGKTQKRINGLKALGVPFEWHNVNDPKYQVHYHALVRTQYAEGTHLDWPTVDVNGKLMDHPSAEEIRDRYQTTN